VIFVSITHKRIFLYIKISDHENSIKVDANDNHDVGVDVDNDDDMPLMGDIDSIDHDSNDMSRPRKIRR
jgi:hypothetical protein